MKQIFDPISRQRTHALTIARRPLAGTVDWGIERARGPEREWLTDNGLWCGSRTLAILELAVVTMAECGFRSVDVMLATFTGLLQTTPGAYRRSFRTSCARGKQPTPIPWAARV
jgi:hypothetical protein